MLGSRCVSGIATAGARKNLIDPLSSQNRQLFIQTELYLGTLAFFLEEYGRVVERLDEARAWKICREMADVSWLAT